MAAALRIAMPLSSIEWLAAVKPSFMVRPVSAVWIEIPAGSTPSSSAATMTSAVEMPWPRSALPVKTVILPLGEIRIQLSRLG